MSRSEEIIEANEANAPKLEDMPEAVKQAQAEHERAKAEAEAAATEEAPAEEPAAEAE